MLSKRLPVFAAGFALVCVAWGQTAGQPSTKNGEWPYYTADARGSKYSPLDQINADNFNKLEVAWRFKTDSLGPRAEYKLEGTPLMVKGVIYTTAGTRRSVVALDAKTGELIWSHSIREGTRAALSPRQLSGRGLSYWTDGKGDERILYVTTGYRLAALNAKNGQAISTFGKDGIVDMKVGAYTGLNTQIDLETGEIGLHATPTVTKDLVLVGSSFFQGRHTGCDAQQHQGHGQRVRCASAPASWSGGSTRFRNRASLVYDTWLNDSARSQRQCRGVDAPITVDEDLGLAYLAVEDPTSDQYGGHRPGNNLFADSLVCVDLKTGKRKWHYQVVHHPMWDYDLSSAPLLADINVDGKAIKAVALPSKQAFLYVFDRVTGVPVWPIEEKPVPKGDVPGEWYSPTQPFPTKPPAYARQAITPDNLIDFTPELRAKALEQVKMYKMGPMFLNPVVSKVGGPLAALTIGTLGGGTNWPGASYDPETHTVYAQAANAGVSPLGLVEPPPGFSDIRYLAGVAGREFRVNEGPGFGSGADAQKTSPTQAKLATILGTSPGAGRGGAPAAAGPGRGGEGGGGTTVDGLILVKPPYGVLSAVNLDRGELMWQVPHGDTPDNVRNHPALKGMSIPKTGHAGQRGFDRDRRLWWFWEIRRLRRRRNIRAERCCGRMTRPTGSRWGRFGCRLRRAVHL